jgi:translocation and assembly module TamB
MLKRILKILLSILYALVVLVLLLALLTQLEVGQQPLGRLVAGILQTRLGASVHIGRLHGNLWHYLSCDDLVIYSKEDTLLSVRDISITWNPVYLLQRRVQVERLVVEQPRLHLVQMADSSLNISRLIPASSPGSARGRFWQVVVDTALLRYGQVTYKPLHKSRAVPSVLDDVNLYADVAIKGNATAIRVMDLSCRLQDPDLPIRSCHARIVLRPKTLALQDVRLQTGRSILTGDAELVITPKVIGMAHVVADPLDGSELAEFWSGLKINGQPRVELSWQWNSSDLTLLANAQQKGESIRLSAKGDRVITPTVMNVRIELDQIHPRTWWQGAPDAQLSGQVRLQGAGWTLANAQWSLDANALTGRVSRVAVRDAAMIASLDGGQVHANLQSSADWGDTQSIWAISDLPSVPRWSVHLDVEDINLARLFNIDTLYSDLNFSADISGQGKTWTQLDAGAEVHLRPSTYNGYPVDSLMGQLHLRDGNLFVPVARLFSPVVDIRADAPLINRDTLNINFQGDFKEPNYLRRLAIADSVHFRGAALGRLYGPPDSLILDLKADLRQVQFNALYADSVKGTFILAILPDSLDGNINARIRNGLVSILPIDSVRVYTHLFKDSLRCTAHAFVKDSIEAKAFFRTYWDRLPIRVIFDKMEAQIMDQMWQGGGDSTRILVRNQNYWFRDMQLIHNDQHISVNGLFSWTRAESLWGAWTKVRISQFNRVFPGLPGLDGLTTGRFHMTGTADQPIMRANLSIDRGQIDGFTYNRFVGEWSYEKEKAVWQATLHHDADNRIQMNGFLPLNLSLTSTQNVLYPQRPFQIGIQAQNLNLDFLSNLSENFRQVKGRLNCDLRLQNTLHNPQPSGFLSVSDGQVYVPRTGKKYQDIQMDIDADSSRLQLKRLQVKSGEGTISGQGTIGFVGGGLAPQLQQLNLALKADNFSALDTRDMAMVLNGDIRLTNSFREPRFEGDVTVVRSRINLPSLADMTASASASNLPMLVALQQDSAIAAAGPKSDSTLFKTLRNVRGSVRIEIPRNTWVRSPEMNIEISGQINVVMNGAQAELFGTIQMIRGDYNLYGRRFEIQSGTITLQGGAEINPVVDLQAQHIFRTADKIKRVLKLQVSGEILEPKLTFLLDNSEIAETDAIAYLIFGRNFDALTQGQRSDLAQDQPGLNSNTFKELLAGQLAGEVTKAIRNTLDLDVIEFKGDNNWRQATVVVGKYITNDLFLSYQREIKMGRTYDTTPEQVTMEYEITRSLFFQATRGDEKNTGFDVIWKYEK